MKTTIKFGLLTAACLGMLSCNDSYLDIKPETTIQKGDFFKTESDMEMYVLNLYDFRAADFYEADATTDNASTTGNKEIKNMMLGNVTAANTTTGWDWDQLRKVNFLLENIAGSNLSEAKKKHYEGLGRYFRARFYAEKVQRFSDVPWVDKVISEKDEASLFGPRNKREEVVAKIMEDFAFAAANVETAKVAGKVNRWVVLQEYSRFALYEGTYRKYHTYLNLEKTVQEFLTKAYQTSEEIMTKGGFSIHNTGKPEADYLSLYNSSSLENNPEVILGRMYATNIINRSDWPGMFGSYEYYPLRDMLQSYLMKDGSVFTSKQGYETMGFVDEFKNRDPRLAQTYAAPGWELIYVSTYSQGPGIYIQQMTKNFSGYHQIKGFLNYKEQDTRFDMDIPLYRYAEVLLNFAEAKAELGLANQADLDRSVNLLRRRAGMPDMPITPALDPKMARDYSNVTAGNKSLILEIRRERRVELAFEGFRFNDLMRWHAGKLLEKKPQGIYFSGLGNHDMTGDGVPDVKLIDQSQSIPEVREKNSLGVPLRYFRVGKFGHDVSFFLSEGNKGYIDVVDKVGEFEQPKYYYRPVPQNDVNLNPNLKQIFNW
ncbi:RagB/SusD family nutrient uptake outer membrane protein [Sphingobacterium lactis]|uniref:SusD family protein n=1 Tax=Sphingobacterium lactis TaxID=797291 RepID=A0A1H5S367_9SPHI|nr:RagB/SusD family nutrient uptake outer membrane protein [Sphingobacterium lactis]SEF44257.1 SusD family protein [Sphingobacterium lactis]